MSTQNVTIDMSDLELGTIAPTRVKPEIVKHFQSYTVGFDSPALFHEVRKDYIRTYGLIEKRNAQGLPERNSDGHIIYQRRGDNRFLDIESAVVVDRVLRHEPDCIYVDCYNLGPIAAPFAQPEFMVTYKGYRDEGRALQDTAYLLRNRFVEAHKTWAASPEGVAHRQKMAAYNSFLCEEAIATKFPEYVKLHAEYDEIREQIRQMREMITEMAEDETEDPEVIANYQDELGYVTNDAYLLKDALLDLSEQVAAFRANWR